MGTCLGWLCTQMQVSSVLRATAELWLTMPVSWLKQRPHQQIDKLKQKGWGASRPNHYDPFPPQTHACAHLCALPGVAAAIATWCALLLPLPSWLLCQMRGCMTTLSASKADGSSLLQHQQHCQQQLLELQRSMAAAHSTASDASVTAAVARAACEPLEGLRLQLAETQGTVAALQAQTAGVYSAAWCVGSKWEHDSRMWLCSCIDAASIAGRSIGWWLASSKHVGKHDCCFKRQVFVVQMLHHAPSWRDLLCVGRPRQHV